ncbi:lytic transglycosylase domain-containing protein [Palleronia sediminis]|nr:lytic transglycosylase domain-containing protein [Palleronia sediminis]
MITRISLFAALVAACLSFGQSASAQLALPRDGTDPSSGIAAALDELRGGSWLGAQEAAARAGPVAADIVEWMYLREGFGTFERARDLLARRPDWPGLARLRVQAEGLLPQGPLRESVARDVIAFFDGADPESGAGTLALVEAYRALGRDSDAEAQAALAWVDRSMTAGAESRLLELYPDTLAPLEQRRAEALFWDRAGNALARSVARLEGDVRDRLEARIAARGGSAPDQVDPRFRTDPGVVYEAFRRAYGRDQYDTAVEIALGASVSRDTLGDPASWGYARRDLTRWLMREGDYDRAYALASTNWMDGGRDFADAEWLAGYIALRFLDQPERALEHFKRFRADVVTPISLGRAGYWLGRAHLALGQTEEAAEAFTFGAQYQTSFYGLLAAESAGLPLDPELVGAQVYPALEDTSFAGSSVLEAGLLLQAAGERDLAETFLTHLAEGLPEAEAGTLGDLVLSLGEPHLALLIAKAVANNGITLPRAYFPVIDPGLDRIPIASELMLAIARRESEFDPGVSSGVGARGLMQLMPGTAREVAAELGLTYSADRLFTDPSYNATLGTAYLAGLIRRFGDNPVLVGAGYNAGPGRPLRWMRERGDPRAPDVDVIDWIEHIPFDETRNYAMRVPESLPVYRARLTGQTGPVRFTEMLKGQ